jgi:Rrf2 family protein
MDVERANGPLRLTRRGEYAIRAMLALAQADGRQLSGRSIGQRATVPASFLPQIMAGLARGGMVHAVRGRSGGYRLRRPPHEISLLDIVQLAEGPGPARRCVLRERACSPQNGCPVHEAFASGEEALIRTLRATRLSDVADATGGDGAARRESPGARSPSGPSPAR